MRNGGDVFEIETEEFITRRSHGSGGSSSGSSSHPGLGNAVLAYTKAFYNNNNNNNNNKQWTYKCWTSTALIFLAICVLPMMTEWTSNNNDNANQDNKQGTTMTLIQQERKKHTNPHSGASFGGVNNIAQPAGAKAAAAVAACQQANDQVDNPNDQIECYQPSSLSSSSSDALFIINNPNDIVIPQSNVGHATTESLHLFNILNHFGHYVHDEHRSPYASHLYAHQTAIQLQQEQNDYMRKMQTIRDTWGAWDFQDPALVRDNDDDDDDSNTDDEEYRDRPVANFYMVDYKDLPTVDFPKLAWQSDPDYIKAFLKQARGLVDRMTEGIYAEYAWPRNKTDGTQMTDKELLKRQEAFAINIVDDPLDRKNKAWNKKKGIATLYKVAMNGLVQKLLHGMMTHDEFYVVLAGHSAAAGHGNDFAQNRIMAFHRIMEPVFDKLGMRLVSRNMAMGGVGTLQFSLAGGDLYGEADILEWDSGMTEKGGPSVDFFNKQAILSGERIPLIMNYFHHEIMKETKGTAWMGKYTDDTSMMPETTYENFQSIPYAARWFDQTEEKYNAICWEPRTDFEPPKKQLEHPGSQVGWHPGFRVHQWQGRRLALIVLKALSMAFDVWEEATQKDGFPLADSYWHVGETYQSIRNLLRTHITTPVGEGEGAEDDLRSPCEKMIPWLPRICRVQMHGFGMWTPRVHEDFDLLNIIQAAPNGYKPAFQEQNVYDGFDLLPYKQKIPDGEVDVHAIALATTNPPPDLDHSWIDENDESVGNGTVASGETPRRMLQEGTKHALRAAATAAAKLTASSTTGNVVKEKRYVRQLQSPPDGEDKVVPGRGWEAHAWSPVNGFCDGSAQSECARTQSSGCLLYGANDNHMDVIGNSLSGWLVFSVPNVKEGIILARMEWWCGSPRGNSLTKDWTEVNNGKTMDTTPWNQTTRALGQNDDDFVGGETARHLKATPDQLIPRDLKMDIAINGKITATMEREEWIQYIGEYGKNVAVWPLLNDESMAQKDWDGEPVQVAIRFRSQESPQQTFCISHIYYA